MPDTSIAERLRSYVTPSEPLGPSDAAQIADLEVAAKLFDIHNKSFNTLLRRDLSVLIGRRGSGKTALLNSYKYRPFLDRETKQAKIGTTSDFRSYDVVIDILTYKQFDRLQRLVMREAASIRPIEAIVDDWESLVTDYFFARLAHDEVEAGRHTDAVKQLYHYLHQHEDDHRRQVREMVWGIPLRERIASLFHIHRQHSISTMNREDALGVAVAHLSETKRRALLICDSMDEYNVGDQAFDRILGALIRFISHFNSRHERVHIKLGLPSEIFPEVRHASVNALKDLGNVEQLSWSATELAQIAAHRFRIFLELYEPDLAMRFADLDLDKRGDVRDFWLHFFPPLLRNRYESDEEPMTYILRHTQLLPRQFLMILKKIINSSHSSTGGYIRFEKESITEAIESMEPLIAGEILKAYEHVYPAAEKLCKPVFANFPTVFSYDELETRWRRKGRPVARLLAPGFDMPEFGEMVIRMGIVGVGQDETDRYYSSHFSYDSLSPVNIGEGHELCLHPIFSRHFTARGNAKRKAIIPRGIAGIRWQRDT